MPVIEHLDDAEGQVLQSSTPRGLFPLRLSTQSPPIEKFYLLSSSGKYFLTAAQPPRLRKPTHSGLHDVSYPYYFDGPLISFRDSLRHL